jgi:hypothetical protein
MKSDGLGSEELLYRLSVKRVGSLISHLPCNKYMLKNVRGHAVAQLVEALRYKPECRGFDCRWVSMGFFIDIILPVVLRP